MRFPNPAPATLWYTRCPVPTAFGIAIQQGLLEREFAADGLEIRSIQESNRREVRASHFDHTQPNSVRQGGNIPAIWTRATGRETRLLGLTWTDEYQAILTLPGRGIAGAKDLVGRRVSIGNNPSGIIDVGRAQSLRGYAIRHQAVRRGEPGALGPDPAPAVTREFLATIPRLRAVLATDVQAAFDGDPAASDTDEIIFSYPGFFAIMVHRLAHELHRRQVPLIPRMMTEYAHSLTGVDIGAGAAIGESFFIDHGTGVVIGETAVIGSRVKIYQGVTLGAISTRGGQGLRGRKRHPTLEDDVTVYSGASVLGGDTVIGRGAVISGNVFVTRSVPPFTRVTVRNPELQYKDQRPQEFTQDSGLDWVI